MNTDLTIPHSDETPAFNALTDLQKKFVLALLQYGSGKGNRTKCARLAGYSGNENSLHVTAHNQFHSNKVRAALREMADAHLMSFQLLAVDGIASLAESARDEGVKLKALLALADRTGFGTVQQINVKHEDVNKTNDQILDGMVALVVKNPKMLDHIEEPRRSQVQAAIAKMQTVQQPEAIDAAYTEVDPDEGLFQ